MSSVLAFLAAFQELLVHTHSGDFRLLWREMPSVPFQHLPEGAFPNGTVLCPNKGLSSRAPLSSNQPLPSDEIPVQALTPSLQRSLMRRASLRDEVSAFVIEGPSKD